MSINETVEMDSQKRVWWEKTVEYAYVSQYLSINALAAPLSGAMEKVAGDAVIARDGTYTIIEFKKDKGAITSEIRKYPGFEGDFREPIKQAQASNNNTFAELKNHQAAKAHFLVYGALNNDGNGLVLHAEHYWEESKKNPKQLDEQGVQHEVLIGYLKQLLEVRGKDERGAGSGGCIVGVSNGCHMMISLDEVFTELQLHHRLKKQNSLDRSPRSIRNNGPR